MDSKQDSDTHNLCPCVDERANKRSVVSPPQCPLAHELRNRLAIVLGCCELIAEADTSEKLAKHLESISKAVWAMTASLEQCRPRKS